MMWISVNGKRLHVQKAGEGRPLILLHGNGEDGRIFQESMALLQEAYTVYAVDLPGHGKSDGVPRLHYADQAEDIVGLIAALQLEKPILYGFSDGGIIGLLLAAAHPTLLACLVASGANLHPSGLDAKTRWDIFRHFLKTRSDKDRLMLAEPHIQKQTLAGISVPVLLTAGENDCVKPSHTRKIADWIPHAALHVFPGEDHGSYIVHSEKIGVFLRTVLPDILAE